MLIVTLGTIASGSTWTFNVVRSLLRECRSNAVSLSTAEALNLLSNIPPTCTDVVVKSHWIDQPFVNLASLFQAKMIVTTRDPRDSFVSHRERFGATLHEGVQALSRTAATIGVLPNTISTLWLRYEEGFADDPAMVAGIARFLELELDDRALLAIFEELRPERVTRAIDRSAAAGALREHGFDTHTHWHAGHVGDRECGKWRLRLRPDDQEAVIGALGTDLTSLDPARTIFWSPKLFTFFDERQGASEEVLPCSGEDQALVWGPYQHLPTGRWRINPLVRLEDEERPVTIRLDTFIPIPGRDVLALRMVNLPVSSPERLEMEFDHHDHLQPLELRIASAADHRSGALRFSGAELTWLGPSERTDRIVARPISQAHPISAK